MKWLPSSLLPSDCLLCDEQAGTIPNLCDACVGSLQLATENCPLCAQYAPGSRVCARCLRKPPSYDRGFSAFVYNDAMQYLVRRAKFHQDMASMLTLGLLLRAHVPWPEVCESVAIVPVPLHAKRQVERGFNQALELARIVASAGRLRVLGSLCKRLRHTEPQTTQADRKARRKNLRGAFRCSPVPTGYHKLVLLDDVLTTGSTVDELARAVRSEFGGELEVWTVCRR